MATASQPPVSKPPVSCFFVSHSLSMVGLWPILLRCPQVVWCHWGEFELLSDMLVQDRLAECDQGIEPGPQGGQTARCIHSPIELSWHALSISDILSTINVYEVPYHWAFLVERNRIVPSSTIVHCFTCFESCHGLLPLEGRLSG